MDGLTSNNYHFWFYWNYGENKVSREKALQDLSNNGLANLDRVKGNCCLKYLSLDGHVFFDAVGIRRQINHCWKDLEKIFLRTFYLPTYSNWNKVIDVWSQAIHVQDLFS